MYTIPKDYLAQSAEQRIKNMILIIGGEETIDQPDDFAIASAVRTVTGWRRMTRRERRRTAPWNVDPSPFLILEHGQDPGGESGYMQADWYPALRRGDIAGFLLEYRDGCTDEHWETHAVSIEDTTAAFIDYLHGRTEWKERFDWKRRYL